MQSMNGKLAMFIIKLFNAEPVSELFDTGETCSCILASLYDQISKEVAMTKTFKSRSGRWNRSRSKRFNKTSDQNK